MTGETLKSDPHILNGKIVILARVRWYLEMFWFPGDMD